MMIRRFFIVIALIAVPAFAQIPTPDEFLGYKLGERFTPHARILDYFNELTKRSNLITVQQFGETYEHRPLVLAVITSAKNRVARHAASKCRFSRRPHYHHARPRRRDCALHARNRVARLWRARQRIVVSRGVDDDGEHAA